MELTLDVQLATRANDLPSPKQLRAWVAAAVARGSAEPRAVTELTIRIVGEREGAALNQRFRGRSGATNVLSFPFEAPELPVRASRRDQDAEALFNHDDELALQFDALIGDLVICAPVVQREALEQGKPLEAHWAHLVVHGVLHLLGHDHLEPAEAERMEGLETEILGRLGFPPPYEVAPGPQ